MALFQCKIFSKELFRSVNVNVTLPTPDSGDCFFDTTTKYPKAGEKYQVLWLLHGFSADESDWQRRQALCICCMAVEETARTGSGFLPLSGMHRRKKLQL